jgi:hypothetical protein
LYVLYATANAMRSTHRAESNQVQQQALAAFAALWTGNMNRASFRGRTTASAQPTMHAHGKMVLCSAGTQTHRQISLNSAACTHHSVRYCDDTTDAAAL